MDEIPAHLLAASLAQMRRRRGAAGGTRIDYSKWSNEARASPIAFMREFYLPLAYACRNCRRQCEYSAEDQKHAIEVLKRRLEWQPTLCDGCYAVRCGLERELYGFRAAWASQRKQLRADATRLHRWLEVLETAPSYGLRRNSGMITHLRKLLAGLQPSIPLAGTAV